MFQIGMRNWKIAVENANRMAALALLVAACLPQLIYVYPKLKLKRCNLKGGAAKGEYAGDGGGGGGCLGRECWLLLGKVANTHTHTDMQTKR